MRLFLAVFLFLIFNLPQAKAQDTLPGFTASLKAGGKVLISWRNGYPAVKQISIQRSSDSLRNFVTLLTVPDPSVAENGFVDNKAGNSKMYYRIFILFPNSKYTFTKSRRAYTEPVDQPLAVANIKSREKPKPSVTETEPALPAAISDQPDAAPAPPVISNNNQSSKAILEPHALDKPKTDSVKKSAPLVKPVTTESKPPAMDTLRLNSTNPPAVSKKPAENKKSPVETVKSPDVKPLIPEEEKYLIFPKIDNSRIFYMMDNSNVRKPSITNLRKIKTPTIVIEKMLFVKRRDSVIMQLPAIKVRRFSDSLLKQTKDTLLFVNADTLQINSYVEVYKPPKEVYKASTYIFTSKDGNVNILLKDAAQKKYYVSFFESDDTPVMEVKDIKDTALIIDKTNFGHAGWFKFELYEDGKLKEKNKFLIPRE